MDARFSVYFSHSWRPRDVDLNLAVWQILGAHCNLLVDQPEDAQKKEYYINRLEELMRRADLFVSVLPHRDAAGNGEVAPRVRGDAGLRCSPGSLFEIRLAERANLPRLVLYDDRTGFRPPRTPAPIAKYVRRNFAELAPFLEHGALEPQLHEEISAWLTWAQRTFWPRRYERSDVSLLLVPPELPRRDTIIDELALILEDANYRRPEILSTSVANDAELFRTMSDGGLLVAELGDARTLSLYAVAHARFLPSIRLFHTATPVEIDEAALPWLLQGHPGGYRHDIVGWVELDTQVQTKVASRAKAMLRATRTFTSPDDGAQFFKSHRYAPGHVVFVSHNLKGAERALVESILDGFRGEAIAHWEYDDHNRAGARWRPEMEAALKGATHFVVLLTPTYEQSVACDAEITTALQRVAQDHVLMFFVGERSVPHRALPDYHHQALRRDVDANAAAVVDRVKEVLSA